MKRFEFHLILQAIVEDTEDVELAWKNAVEGFYDDPGFPDDQQIREFKCDEEGNDW